MSFSSVRRVYDHNTNSKSSFWKRQNSKNKKQRLIKLFILIILLFVTVNTITKIPIWIQSINKPFDKIQTSIDLSSRANKDIRTNILLMSVSEKNSLQDLALASFNSDQSAVTIIKIPVSGKVYSDALGQNLSLSTIYFSKPYSESEFDSIYITTKELLALPLDGYFSFHADDLEFDENTIQIIKSKMSFWGLITNSLSYKSWLNQNMKTNYSISAIARLAWDFRQISKEKVVLKDLTDALEKKEFNLSDVDIIIQEEISDSSISNEAAVVEVFGGGFYSQLVSRVVNNLGASTIHLGSEGKSSETKLILGSDKNKIAERLSKFMKVRVETGDIESGADAKVIVGGDFEAKFYGN